MYLPAVAIKKTDGFGNAANVVQMDNGSDMLFVTYESGDGAANQIITVNANTVAKLNFVYADTDEEILTLQLLLEARDSNDAVVWQMTFDMPVFPYVKEFLHPPKVAGPASIYVRFSAEAAEGKSQTLIAGYNVV